jgi:PAS domain S-box-containing protein
MKNNGIRILVADDDPDILKSAVEVLQQEGFAVIEANGFDAGADGYLARPVSNRQLVPRRNSMAQQVRLINERKLAEEALRRKQKMLERTEKAAHIGSWEWDMITGQVTWSDELFCIFQRDPLEGAPGYPEQATLYHPDDLARLGEAVEAAVTMGTPYQLELRVLRKDGMTRDCLAHGFAKWGREGRVVRLYGSLQDITDRKRAEQNYQTLFREMLDGFALHEIICDEAHTPVDYRFLAVNPAFERMTGVKAADIIGKTVLQAMPAVERYWIETYGRVARTGEPVHFENYSGDLQKHFEVTAFRPAPNQFACLFIDISARKKAEAEKELLQSQLVQAQKMEAIGTLAGGIAHDFNNILGAMLGYAEMVREDSPAGSLLAKDLDQILSAGNRAKALVKQILAFSRQAEETILPLQPAILIKETIKLLRASLPTTIEIKQDVDMDCHPILADPTQIDQIVMNLCTNAFHAMEENGGTLSISLKKRSLEATDLANQPTMLPGHFMHLSVKDTGAGIKPEMQAKVFDPYFTTKETGKGTGMGLAITHGIVKRSGGFITLKSQVGTGTVFDIFIPAWQGNATPENVGDDAISMGTERILLVDDEPMLAEMSRTMLERLGYSVTVRMGGREALTAFRNQPEAFDLVITDQTMPGMTGTELARSMLRLRPDLPIILCTGYSSTISQDRIISYGIKGFALKPLAKREIAFLIRKVLDEHPVTS